eukprot:347674-Pelagomonas_calceolata.AAC.1
MFQTPCDVPSYAPCEVAPSQSLVERKKRKTTQAVKTLPTSVKEKRIPRAEAPSLVEVKVKK